MLSATGRSVILALFISTPALASVCPDQVGGHKLSRGQLYDGPISLGADLRPDTHMGSARKFLDTWQVHRPARTLMACHYEGLAKVVEVPVGSARVCWQSERAMWCE